VKAEEGCACELAVYGERYSYCADNPTNSTDPSGLNRYLDWFNEHLNPVYPIIVSYYNGAESRLKGASWYTSFKYCLDGAAQVAFWTTLFLPYGGATIGGKTAASGVGANGAYETALAGGRHSGTLANYAGRSVGEIQKAIASYGRQVALHAVKIANPAEFVGGWDGMTAAEQAGLLNKWAADMARNQELADVLRGLLGSK
jgi:hypothetical protein